MKYNKARSRAHCKLCNRDIEVFFNGGMECCECGEIYIYRSYNNKTRYGAMNDVNNLTILEGEDVQEGVATR